MRDVGQSIPARFGEAVRRHGGRTAVRSGRTTVTYEQLDRATNALARALLERRGAAAEPVAILTAHDRSAIVALLGVLKAGSFHVPLDPTYPLARLAFMVADSRARVVLADRAHLRLAHELGCDPGTIVVIEDVTEVHVDPPAVAIPPDAYAYVAYTSGSTGQPKGVIQTHRNALYYADSYARALRISYEDRLGLVYSCSSGSGILDILAGLVNGAALCMLDIRAEGLDALAPWIDAEQISVLHFVASIFRYLVRDLSSAAQLDSVRILNIGGEMVRRSDVDLYRHHLADHCLLSNGYACTESQIGRRYLIDKHTEFDGGILPVGYPTAGTSVLLLDEDGHEVAPGAIGEITFKGRYLSPGYWGRPDLTAAAYQPAPDDGGERLYRTGDLGRFLADGCLVLLGRKDAQVQIRGARVEPAEVEQALLELPPVRDVCVVAHEAQEGEARLVAYLVLDSERPVSDDQLRHLLRVKLPEHMIPSIFLRLPRLPMAPGGKIDRRALPSPDGHRPRLDRPFVAPRSPLERTLAEIWADVLDLERVGVHDQFLSLGGDSLLATRVATRVRSALNVDLPLRALLEADTVAAMSDVVISGYVDGHGSAEVERLLTDVESLSDDAATGLAPP
jgi:amino acid adenylation domain-containing protein